MTSANVKNGTTLKSKDGSYEMVVFRTHKDGFDVRVFSTKSGRQTGVKFVCNHEVKFFNVQ